jgi:hypothetical protein
MKKSILLVYMGISYKIVNPRWTEILVGPVPTQSGSGGWLGWMPRLVVVVLIHRTRTIPDAVITRSGQPTFQYSRDLVRTRCPKQSQIFQQYSISLQI